MSKTYRECAIEHLKQGNLCKGYVDYIVGEVEKLQKIEQIVNSETDPNICNNVGDVRKVQAIKKILEKE